jgi:DNA-binding beta-propeller fold protein YncE
MEPVIPAGPPPSISVSLAFGDAPVEGFAYLRPRSDTRNWRYSVDVDEDGSIDHQGVLEGDIGFAYRFTSPGVHYVHARLEGPEGFREDSAAVVVNDLEAVRVLNQRVLVDPNSDVRSIFEGITMDHAGRFLYVGDFENSEIHRVDPTTLQSLARLPPLVPSEAPFGRVEGLAVAPSDSLLVVAHKYYALSVVAVPSMGVRRTLRMEGEFFVHALDDTLAISTGGGLVLVDTRSGATLRRASISRAWHFAVSTERGLIAVAAYGEMPSLHIVSMPTFEVIARIELPSVDQADVVAFDPYEDKVYVMGRRAGESHFILVDLPSRAVILDMPLGPGSCGYCAANPVATASNRRFVGMEQGGGVYFIDTSFDLPRYYIGLRSQHTGMSVTASPIEDAFYLLRSDGLLLKVRIEE